MPAAPGFAQRSGGIAVPGGGVIAPQQTAAVKHEGIVGPIQQFLNDVRPSGAVEQGTLPGAARTQPPAYTPQPGPSPLFAGPTPAGLPASSGRPLGFDQGQAPKPASTNALVYGSNGEPFQRSSDGRLFPIPYEQYRPDLAGQTFEPHAAGGWVGEAIRMALGSYVPPPDASGPITGGSGIIDDIPAPMAEGSFVINKRATARLGIDYLASLAKGGLVPTLVMGGEFKFSPQDAARIGTDRLKTLNAADGGFIRMLADGGAPSSDYQSDIADARIVREVLAKHGLSQPQGPWNPAYELGQLKQKYPDDFAASAQHTQVVRPQSVPVGRGVAAGAPPFAQKQPNNATWIQAVYDAAAERRKPWDAIGEATPPSAPPVNVPGAQGYNTTSSATYHYDTNKGIVVDQPDQQYAYYSGGAVRQLLADGGLISPVPGGADSLYDINRTQTDNPSDSYNKRENRRDGGPIMLQEGGLSHPEGGDTNQGAFNPWNVFRKAISKELAQYIKANEHKQGARGIEAFFAKISGNQEGGLIHLAAGGVAVSDDIMGNMWRTIFSDRKVNPATFLSTPGIGLGPPWSTGDVDRRTTTSDTQNYQLGGLIKLAIGGVPSGFSSASPGSLFSSAPGGTSGGFSQVAATFPGGFFASSLAGVPGGFGGFGALKGYNLSVPGLPGGGLGKPLGVPYPSGSSLEQTSGPGATSPFLGRGMGGPISLDMGGYSLPKFQSGSPVSIDMGGYELPAFQGGGFVDATASPSTKTPPVVGGVPVHLHIGGETYELEGKPEVAEQLVTAARARHMAQGGKFPGWYG